MENSIRLDGFSVTELNFEELLAIDGGSFWKTFGIVCGVIACIGAAVALGYGIGLLIAAL